MTTRRRSRWPMLLRLLLTALLVGFVLSRVHPRQAWAALQQAGWAGLLPVVLLLPINLGIQWVRWHFLVRTGGIPLGARESLKVMLAGLPLGLVTPGRMGEMGRGALVAGSHDAVAVAGLTVLEKTFNILGGTGLALAAMVLTGYGTAWKWGLIAGLYAGAVLVALHPFQLARLADRLAPRLPGRLGERIALLAGRFVDGWRRAGRRAALMVLFLSILQVAVALLQLTLAYLPAAGTGEALKVAGAWAVVLGAKYFLPVTVADLGVREGLAVLVFADRGLPASPALAAALLIYVVNVLLPALPGALLLARRPIPPAPASPSGQGVESLPG
jgi:uncharacterized protein (TIRG00374 family)